MTDWTCVCRSVSSEGAHGRRALRECDGLVEALLVVASASLSEHLLLDDPVIEHCVCTLRNLSFACQELVEPDYLDAAAKARRRAAAARRSSTTSTQCTLSLVHYCNRRRPSRYLLRRLVLRLECRCVAHQRISKTTCPNFIKFLLRPWYTVERSIVMSMSVCRCVSVSGHERISGTARPIFAKFFCMLPVAVTRFWRRYVIYFRFFGRHRVRT